MKDKKTFIIWGILISVCFIIIIMLIIQQKVNNRQMVNVLTENDQWGDIKTKYSREIVRNQAVFYTVEDCINNNEGASFIATKMYASEENNICSYAVEGVKNDGTYNTKIFFKVVLDTNNFTYEVTKMTKCKNIEDINIDEKIEEIEENENNKYVYNRISDREVMEKYIVYYENLIKNNPKKAYELLNEEYKEKRFNTYNKFSEFIKKRKETLNDIKIVGVKTYKNNEIEKYILTDQNNMNYIIEETSPMNFNIQLDDYTISNEENEKEYIYATDLEKVQLDVDKFINILSNYDYESAYSLLSEEYKINNFETLSKYIKFLEKNFYNNRIYSIENIEKDLQDYIVTVKVKENDRTASEEKINKIVISLGEKADFTMAVIVE